MKYVRAEFKAQGLVHEWALTSLPQGVRASLEHIPNLHVEFVPKNNETTLSVVVARTGLVDPSFLDEFIRTA